MGRNIMRKCRLVGALLLSISMMGIFCLPSVFLPKRWLDIQPGISRAAVHAVLGVPDASFSDKSFDGWHKPFGVGASVLTVRYDSALSKAVSTEIKTVWGFEHKKWVQEYKRHVL